MQVRVITMRYSGGIQGFPEDALRRATFGREEEAMRCFKPGVSAEPRGNVFAFREVVGPGRSFVSDAP